MAERSALLASDGLRLVAQPNVRLGGILGVVPARDAGVAQISTPRDAPARLTVVVPARQGTPLAVRLQPVDYAHLPILGMPGYVAARGFTIDVHDANSGAKITRHTSPLELLVAYDETDLGLTGGDPVGLVVMRWDDALGRSLALRTEVDFVSRVLHVSLDHTSLFVVAARRPSIPELDAAPGQAGAPVLVDETPGRRLIDFGLPLPLAIAVSALLGGAGVWILRGGGDRPHG